MVITLIVKKKKYYVNREAYIIGTIEVFLEKEVHECIH